MVTIYNKFVQYFSFLLHWWKYIVFDITPNSRDSSPVIELKISRQFASVSKWYELVTLKCGTLKKVLPYTVHANWTTRGARNFVFRNSDVHIYNTRNKFKLHMVKKSLQSLANTNLLLIQSPSFVTVWAQLQKPLVLSLFNANYWL